MKYIALLRGINVGGQKKIKMVELRAMCEKMGFGLVKTYIQSGNIIFESSEKNTAQIENQLCEHIQITFGFDVPVMVMKQTYVEEVLNNNPYLNKDPELDQKLLHVTFLATIPSEDLVNTMKEKDYGTDAFEVIGKRIYLYFPNGYGRTKLTNNLFEKKLKVAATTRNWRTLGKLKEF